MKIFFLLIVFSCSTYAFNELPKFASDTPCFTRISLSRYDDIILDIAYDSAAEKNGIFYLLKNKDIGVFILPKFPGDKYKKIKKNKLIRYNEKDRSFSTFSVCPFKKTRDKLMPESIKFSITPSKGTDNPEFFSHTQVYINELKKKKREWIYYFKGTLKTDNKLSQSSIFRYYEKPEFKLEYNHKNEISIDLFQKNSEMPLLYCKPMWSEDYNKPIKLKFTSKNWQTVKKDETTKRTVAPALYKIDLNAGEYYIITSIDGGPLWGTIAATNIIIVKQKQIDDNIVSDIELFPYEKSDDKYKNAIVRSWKDNTGKIIVATLINYDENFVFLKRKDNKTGKIELKKLSKADYEYVLNFK